LSNHVFSYSVPITKGKVFKWNCLLIGINNSW
jgi:hypothetical protein